MNKRFSGIVWKPLRKEKDAGEGVKKKEKGLLAKRGKHTKTTLFLKNVFFLGTLVTKFCHMVESCEREPKFHLLH